MAQHQGHTHKWTTFGISQPENGKMEICETCKNQRLTDHKTNKRTYKTYIPPTIRGDAVPLFDLSKFPMTEEGKVKEIRKQERDKRKQEQRDIAAMHA